MRFPDLRRDPLSTVDTLSLRPASWRSSRFPFIANELARDATRSVRTFDNALMISSAIPSARNSFSGSALRFSNGSTPTDFEADPAGADIKRIDEGVERPPAVRFTANSRIVSYLSDASTDNARWIDAIASGETCPSRSLRT